MEDTVPNSTTVCRFWNTLVEAGLYDMILDEINHKLKEKDIIVRHDVIVETSIIDTPRRPRGYREYEVMGDCNEEDGRETLQEAMLKEVVKSNVDGDARWNKKMEKLHFGYKRHTVTDENGLVLAEETMATNESDINHLETPLKKAGLPQGPPIYADKG